MMSSALLPRGTISFAFLSLVLAACGLKKTQATADGGVTLSSGVASATASDAPTLHCMKSYISRCEETSEARLAAAKAKLEAGTPDEKSVAKFMTPEAFKGLCDKGEYGTGPCPTANAVGACASPSDRRVLYAGDKGYTADEFAYECGKKSTPETVDGKPLPAATPKRMSCFHKKTSTCEEDDFHGRSSRTTFCTANGAFDGPTEFALAPCPTDKRTASCKDKPMELLNGKSLEETRVRFAYGAKAGTSMKEVCGYEKGTFTKL